MSMQCGNKLVRISAALPVTTGVAIAKRTKYGNKMKTCQNNIPLNKKIHTNKIARTHKFHSYT